MVRNVTALYSILSQSAGKVAAALDFSPLAGKTVLVTGGNGLLGLNFVVSLVSISKQVPGIRIVAVVRSSPSDVLTSLQGFGEIEIVQGDLTDEAFIRGLPAADVIIHAAGSGIPVEFLKHRITSLKINTTSTFGLFEKLKESGRFLFISSSDVYNGLVEESYREDQIGTTNTDHPRACYIEGKRTGEAICGIFHQEGVHACAVRLSPTYGPGVSYNDSRVLPSFIRKGLNGRIELLDSGDALRTFCYVSDAIEMIWFVLLYGKHALYNIGNTDVTTVRDLAGTIGRILGVPVEIPEAQTGIAGAPRAARLDISRYLSEANKAGFVPLEDGLGSTIEWLRLLKEAETS